MVSWLITSVNPHDDDHRFGLADPSSAFSALGWMSQAELTALTGPLCLPLVAVPAVGTRYP